MGRPRKNPVQVEVQENQVEEQIEEMIEETNEESTDVKVLIPSELDKLHALYAELKALGIHSIGDLEVKIARLS